jgi:hypothetical protein
VINFGEDWPNQRQANRFQQRYFTHKQEDISVQFYYNTPAFIADMQFGQRYLGIDAEVTQLALLSGNVKPANLPCPFPESFS